MPTDAIITLNRLSCIAESDGTGNSEPYIWPDLMWIDDNTLDTPEQIGVTARALGNARVVIKSDMRAGQTADIPTSVRTLRVRFADGLTIQRLILVVALLEEDETPEAAMRAGFIAFFNELRDAIANNLVALHQATVEERKPIIEAITKRVRARVEMEITNGLTSWQKARVLLGTLNLDDFIESSFNSDLELAPSSIALDFNAGTSNHYQIEGDLQVRPVPVLQCQAQLDRVNAAQAAVDNIDATIKRLQSDLSQASPSEKPFIISEIKQLRREELAPALAALQDARLALRDCQGSVRAPV